MPGKIGMIPDQKYPPSQTIFVDVDGTLHTRGVVNQRVVDFCKKQKEKGFTLCLWSARGKEYAQEAAEAFDVAWLFDDIVSKPGYILDDLGWSWIQYTRVIQSIEIMNNA